MITVTKVISTNYDKAKRLLVKVLRYGKSDIQTPLEYSPYGVDSNPVKDMVAIYAQTGEKGEQAIIGYLNKERLSEPGELRLFSTNPDGALQTYIWLKKDGKLEIGGNADNMVRFSKLEDGFNEMKEDLNAFIQKYNTFAMAYTPGSPAILGTPPTVGQATESQATISDAKIDEILTL